MRRHSVSGFTIVVVLVLLAIVSLGLSVAGPMWSQQVRRERERELLRVGTLYADALANYYTAAPGMQRQYPLRLEALLLDTRYVGVVRHLRSLYFDPVNPDHEWGLMKDESGRVFGVFSTSEQAPMAEGRLEYGGRVFAPAKRYSDWKFVAKVAQ